MSLLPLSSFPDAGLPTLLSRLKEHLLIFQRKPLPTKALLAVNNALVRHSNSQSPCCVQHLHLLHTKHSYLDCCQILWILAWNLSKISCHPYPLKHPSVSELAYLNLYKLYQLSQYYARSVQNPAYKILHFLEPGGFLLVFQAVTFALATLSSSEDLHLLLSCSCLT